MGEVERRAVYLDMPRSVARKTRTPAAHPRHLFAIATAYGACPARPLQREFGGAVGHTNHKVEHLPAGDADNIVLNFDCILDIAGVIS